MSPLNDPELLLSHSGWMRALAFELLGDAQGAEDVVQDAWVVAMEKRPEEKRRLPAWLAGVVRHRASHRVRGDARRARREKQVARREAVPSTEEALERFAVQQRVVEAVMALDAADREVIVLRYFEELPPRVVAQRLGLTGSAVRSRLSRCLEKLRSQLDESHGGDRQSWAVGLGLWVSRPEVALSAVPLKLILGGLAATAGLGWFAATLEFPGVGPRNLDEEPLALSALSVPATPESVVPTDGVELSSERAALPLGEWNESAGEIDAVPGDEAIPQVAIHLRFVDPLGATVAGVRTTARDAEDVAPFVSDDDGRVVVELDWPPANPMGSWQYLDVEGEGITGRWLRTRLSGPGPIFLGDVTVEAGGDVRGRVVDSSGRPVEGARVYAGEPPESTHFDEDQRRVSGTITLGNQGATTDADGQFELRGVPARRVCVFGKTGDSLYVFSEPFSVLRADFVFAPDLVMDPAADDERFAGTVFDASGTPLQHVRVAVYRPDGVRITGALGTNAEGGFSTLVPPANDYELVAQHPDHGELRVPSLSTGTEHELRFPAARWMEIAARGRGEAIETFKVISKHRDDYGQRVHGKVVAPGVMRFLIPAQVFHLEVDAVGWRARALGPFEPSNAPERLEVDLEPAGGIRGRLMEDEQPLIGVALHAHRVLTGEPTWLAGGFASRVDPRALRHAVTDSEGRFFLEFEAVGEFELHAELADRGRAAWERLAIDPSRVLDLGDVEWSPTGAIEGEWVGAENVMGRMVAASCGDGHVESLRVGTGGTFAFPSVRAGGWEVRPIARSDEIAVEQERRAGAPDSEEVPSIEGEVVVVNRGHTAQVRLREAASTDSRIEGRVRIGASASVFSRVAVRGQHDVAWSNIDGDGRFALRIEERGRASIEMMGFQSQSVRWRLHAPLALESKAVEWSFERAAGEIELAGLGDGNGAGFTNATYGARYTLIRAVKEEEGSVTFAVELSGEAAGSVRLSNLPIGHYVLSEAGKPSGPVGFHQELAQFDLTAGARLRHDLGN